MTESTIRFSSYATDISGNGRFLIYHDENPDGSHQLARYDLFSGEVALFANDTIEPPRSAVISGDGRFVAYGLNIAGTLFSNINLYDFDLGINAELGGGLRGNITSISTDGSAVIAYTKALYSPEAATLYYDTISGEEIHRFNGVSRDVSADGRYVITHIDTHIDGSIYRHDITSLTQVLVSSNAAAQEGNGANSGGSISANGQLVAFSSSSTNLIENDTNEATDVFVKDLDTGLVYLASAGAEQANGNSVQAAISGNGRYVVFVSEASNLVEDDTNGVADVFRKDLWTGDIELVSQAIAGGAANGMSAGPSISDDGRYIKFTSEASNLVADDMNGTADAFVVDMGIEPDEVRPSGGDLRAAFQRVNVTDPGSTKAQAETITLQDGSVITNPLYIEAVRLDELIALYQRSFVTEEQVQDKIINLASDTTAVAVMTYQFFTGQTLSTEGLSYLIDSPLNNNDLTDPYYAKFNEDNRYINFAVNLGKLGEGKEDFAQEYGQLTFDQAVRKAYDVVIGNIKGEAAGINLDEVYTYIESQQSYFSAVGGDDIGAKAAMIGYLMYEGFRASLGHYAEMTDAYLQLLYDGGPHEVNDPASYNVDNDVGLIVTGYADTVGFTDLLP